MTGASSTVTRARLSSRGIRRELTFVEIGRASFVLHDQCSTVVNKIEQLLIIRTQDLSACRKHGFPERLSDTGLNLACDFVGRNQSDLHPDLLEHRRNIISRAHNVADIQILRYLHVDNADALQRWLVIVESCQDPRA